METRKDIKRQEMSKAEARAYMKERRGSVLPKERRSMDAKIQENLFSLSCVQDAKWCYTFISYKTEVDTLGIIKKAWQSGKHVAVPKVVKDQMIFYEITDFAQLQKGYQGILEPDEKQCLWEVTPKQTKEASVFLMPGLAFDEAKHRVGYGGGFYDRYLEKNMGMNMTTIALAYDFQIVEKIVAQEFDIPVQWILTEKRLL